MGPVDAAKSLEMIATSGAEGQPLLRRDFRVLAAYVTSLEHAVKFPPQTNSKDGMAVARGIPLSGPSRCGPH